MRIRKNPETNYLLIIFVVLLFCCVLASTCISRNLIYDYKLNLYNNDAVLLGSLKDDEDAQLSVIKAINANSEADIEAGKQVLEKYGINKDNITQISDEYYQNALLILAPSLVAMLSALFIFLFFLEKQYKRINEITNYSQRVLQKDYSLDIRENSEGDISKLKNEIYKITVTLKEAAEQQTKDKERLAIALSDISHQLKTPMTSLFVMTDLLKEDKLPIEKKQEFMETIQNQLTRINWLVSSLLTLSKLDAKAIAMKKETNSIKKLIDLVLEPLSIPAEIKGVEIVHGELNVNFSGDLNWSREAVINIIKNCIEHTEATGRIEINAEENNLYTSLSIKDNGEGISKKDLRHIFDRFYRGTNAAVGSVGIGLAMAKAIIVEQGGDIFCQSKINVGTEFIIKWPK